MENEIKDFLTIKVETYKNGEYIPQYSYSYLSRFAPRVGEYLSYQYWEMEIYKIVWIDENNIIVYADCYDLPYPTYK